MAYVSPNFRSKKALKEAVVAGKEVMVFSPGPFPCSTDGRVTIEGFWFPEPHRFYATAVVERGRVIKIVG